MASGNQADQALAFARAQIGKPYVFGATGPNSYDCSGLVYAAYKSVGITLGRTTYQQVLNGTAVSRTELKIGDLVFPDAGHVQIYSGGGNIVESPHTGANVREVPMWGFWKARRIIAGGGTGSAVLVSTETAAASPLNPISALTDVLQGGTQFFNLVTDPGTYKRVSLIITGGVMVVIGAFMLGSESFNSDTVSTVTKAVTKVSK
jgi:NlpC/P60 family